MRGLKASEKEIQNQILIYLVRVRRLFVEQINNGGVYDPTRKIFRKSRNPFKRNGTADIIGIYRGFFIAIEVKSATGRQSEDQKAWQYDCENAGGRYCLARNLLDVENFLRSIDQSLDEE